MADTSYYEEELRKLLAGVRAEEEVEDLQEPDVDEDSSKRVKDLVEEGFRPVQDTTDVTRTTERLKEEPASPEKITGEAGPSAPVSRKNLFTHHDSSALLLDMVLLQKYGPPYLAWEAETVWDEIKDDFNQTVSSHNAAKIQAMRTLHTVETPWKAWEAFVPVCQALNNNLPDFRSLQRPTPTQILYTVTVMKMVDPEEEFSEEVSQFIAACFLDNDVFYLPPPVDFAQDEAKMLKYRCKKCGRIDVDEDNMVCDSCGAPESQLEKEPTWDPEPVKRRYDHILRQDEDHDVLQETMEDIQVAKLLVAKDYVEFRNEQLRQQAEAVDNG